MASILHLSSKEMRQLSAVAAALLLMIGACGGQYSSSTNGGPTGSPTESSGATSSTPPYEITTWTPAHATFYGGEDASGTQGGACGYGDLSQKGYGTATAALSTVLFNGGYTCGACFEIKCDLSFPYSSKWCYHTGTTITITGTNLCPPNYSSNHANDGWCNPPRSHFDLAYPSFARLAHRVAGIISIQYRRVACRKYGGLKFRIDGNPWFNLVLVYNVGGPGSVTSMAVKGSNTNWFTMTKNWGQKWQDHNKLVGQSLSFKVTTAGGTSVYIVDLTGTGWQHGSMYASNQNFDADDMNIYNGNNNGNSSSGPSLSSSPPPPPPPHYSSPAPSTPNYSDGYPSPSGY